MWDKFKKLVILFYQYLIAKLGLEKERLKKNS